MDKMSVLFSNGFLEISRLSENSIITAWIY